MDAIAKNLRTLRRLDWYFIIIGLLEIFILIFLTSSIYAMILGLISIIPAYIALTEKNINWNYFVSIWTMIRYNPLTCIAMLDFIIKDFFWVNGKNRLLEGPTTWKTVLVISIIIGLLLLVLVSFSFGIILIAKTIKHNNLKKSQKLTELK